MIRYRTIQRADHGIESDQLSTGAFEVAQVLNSAGFTGELVGGCVRDILLGKQPKDFDVATDATPEQVRSLFRRSVIIGRRFRLVEIRIRREIVQVATYRAAPGSSGRFGSKRNFSSKGKILKDNNYGNIEQDAFRRDLTINSLYLNPLDMTICDYTGGFDDVHSGTIRVIGNPDNRYQEDPVRILRAIRFAATLDFQIDAESAEPIPSRALLLGDVSNARFADEIKKLFFTGHASSIFGMLNEYDVFHEIFPCYSKNHGYVMDEFTLRWLAELFHEMDDRVRSHEPLSVSYTMAAILWLPYSRAVCREKSEREKTKPDSMRLARDILNLQNRRTYITKAHDSHIQEIWRLQTAMMSGKSNNRNIVENRRLRAAVRLLELRSKLGEVSRHTSEKWREICDQRAHPKHKNRRYRGKNKRMIRA